MGTILPGHRNDGRRPDGSSHPDAGRGRDSGRGGGPAGGRARTGRSRLLPVALLALAALACAAPPEPDELISRTELAAHLESGEAPLVLDVRTPAEYRDGHVPGAVNVPHRELEDRLPELDLPPDREIVVYCEAGPRAAAAGETLREAGFSEVLHLEGHMRGWRRSDLPCAGC